VYGAWRDGQHDDLVPAVALAATGTVSPSASGSSATITSVTRAVPVIPSVSGLTVLNTHRVAEVHSC
jgi:hypothetical protein